MLLSHFEFRYEFSSILKDGFISPVFVLVNFIMLKCLLTILEIQVTRLEFLLCIMNPPQAFAARDKKPTILIQISLNLVLNNGFTVNWFQRPNF